PPAAPSGEPSVPLVPSVPVPGPPVAGPPPAPGTAAATRSIPTLATRPELRPVATTSCRPRAASAGRVTEVEKDPAPKATAVPRATGSERSSRSTVSPGQNPTPLTVSALPG